jgi:hypothetical protein
VLENSEIDYMERDENITTKNRVPGNKVVLATRIN